ncbi:MAG: AAA family ATPase [Sedimentisphaerales bacterium]|nr:AAA family ATPase [Sedimentisphaerales bacterium]
MLTKIIIRNFKRFSKVEIELGNPVVFIGPNNSGKTSALQALALWDVGLRRWTERRKKEGSKAEKRTGVVINRRALFSVPVPGADHLWRDLHVRDVQWREERQEDGSSKRKQVTRNVRIDIVVDGVTEDVSWRCGLEFDYANDESFYCRPLRASDGKKMGRMPIPDKAEATRIAFLPPMSGLAANETRLDGGAINVRIGEGRTAEVLRNLSYIICAEHAQKWEELQEHIKSLFGVTLDAPKYITERGEIVMTYHENGRCLDLSSSGRGLQQTLLLLTYMFNNPGAVLLLDEPDAHLEILRQQQIYQLLTDVARGNGNQIIAASHSEVLLTEAAGRDVVVAFLGQQPHRIDDRGSQVLKSLKEIGFQDYYLAEQTGWVLYLEGSTDLALLRAFAGRLHHSEAQAALDRPFVRYVRNMPSEVSRHFYGVQEAVRNLHGVAIFDRIDQEVPSIPGVKVLTWRRREIENYLCSPETLLAYARQSAHGETPGELFTLHEADKRTKVISESIDEITKAMDALGKGGPWDSDTKVSDDFLTPLFRSYFKKLGLPNLMDKKRFYELADFVPEDQLDPEIKEKLAAIVEVWKTAAPQ